MRRHLFVAIVAALALIPVGCGEDGKKVVKVTGTVSRNGKPVPNLTLHFTPTTGRPSWGKTDETGKYELDYDLQRKGAEVGTHKVHVEFRVTSPEDEHQRSIGNWKLPEDHRAILSKYGNRDKPEINVEVKNDGKPVDIVLD